MLLVPNCNINCAKNFQQCCFDLLIEWGAGTVAEEETVVDAVAEEEEEIDVGAVAG